MYPERSVDVAILGAGTAGLSALREVRKITGNFLLINGGPAGTACARVGCMPSKVLIQVSNDFHRRHVFATEGIRGGAGLQVDLPAVMAYVRTLRDYFVGGVVKDLEDLGPRYLEGYARFCEPTVLEVNGRLVHTKKTIIATGSAPVIPRSWRALGDRLLTSDTLFEQKSLPASIAVVGLGGIGVELGQACAQLGVAVTGFDIREQVAGLTDPEVNTICAAACNRTYRCIRGARRKLRQTETACKCGARTGQSTPMLSSQAWAGLRSWIGCGLISWACLAMNAVSQATIPRPCSYSNCRSSSLET